MNVQLASLNLILYGEIVFDFINISIVTGTLCPSAASF